MSKQQLIKEFRSRQQVKDEQISYDAKKCKKILLSAKQSYDKTVAENRELKAYIENLKQHMQKQQVQFLEKQRNYYQQKKQFQKNTKK